MNNFTYEIISVIGQGGFSTVYKAKSKIDNKIVALKKVNLSKMKSPKDRTDCLQEVVLLQQLNHPNVICYMTSYIEKKQLNIIFEYANGGDLNQLIQYFIDKKRLIPEKVIWKIFVQIASGLSHMHSKRIMHRDIKPPNVFMTKDEVVKLGDLGLARYFSSNTIDTNSNVGTVYYMSPERISHHPYTFSSDIWSLGCLLHELAALRSPFYSGDNLCLVVHKIENADYIPIPSPIYSKQLSQLKEACLRKLQNERPDISYVYNVALKMNVQFSN